MAEKRDPRQGGGILAFYPDADEYEPKDGCFAISRDYLMKVDVNDRSIPFQFRQQAAQLQGKPEPTK